MTNNPPSLISFVNGLLYPTDVAKNDHGEVFTPFKLINEMLNTLPAEYWSDPNKTWIDPAAGIGNFQFAIYDRLYIGLKKVIPDNDKRKKHIIEKMLYYAEYTSMNVDVYKKLIDPENIYKLNLYCGDSLSADFSNVIDNVWNIKTFDVVIGNPPYNEFGLLKTIYDQFFFAYEKRCTILMFITPHRWVKGGRSNLDTMRNYIFNSNKLSILKSLSKAEFPGTNIAGGVSYFVFDNTYSGELKYNNKFVDLKKYDILVDGDYIELLEKILKGKYFLSSLIKNNISNIQSNLTIDQIGIDFSDIQTAEYPIVLHVNNSLGHRKYLRRDIIDTDDVLKKYIDCTKVSTMCANGSAPSFGRRVIVNKGETASKSYINFIVENAHQATNLLQYLNTNFCNFFLHLRKITQGINKTKILWIPLPDLNEEWSDEKLFNYYDLTTNEIDMINAVYKK